MSAKALESLEILYCVYISAEGGEVYRLSEEDIKYSGLMSAMFLENEFVSTQANPFVFPNIKAENLGIIMRYIKKCVSDRKELPEPSKPLPRTALPDILGGDYDIIRHLMESDRTDRDKLSTLSALVMDITYLDMVPLREKMCAAIASMFIGKSLEAIDEMTQTVN